MSTLSPNDLRATLLQVIAEQQPKRRMDGSLQSTSVLREVAERVNVQGNLEQALLTQFHDLFRTGYLAWGMNLSNPNPPFFHITSQGSQALKNYSRDPGNPAGYFQHIDSLASLNKIAMSYLKEAVSCYNASLVKSAAVMVGGAAESLVIELREEVLVNFDVASQAIPKGLKDWRVKTVGKSLQKHFEAKKKFFPTKLREDFEVYWLPFTHQIRVCRNDAGHPASIEPVTQETVHAALLIFPELAKLQKQLLNWLAKDRGQAA